MRSSGPAGSSQSAFLESPQVLVVEASAGSGKTYALAKRYVQLILHLRRANTGLPIQSVLAITFTNKASHQMKSRILDLLKRIALKQLKPFETEDIIKPLGLDEAESSTLAFELMNDVLRQYHYFQVQTIDSFINVLLVGCSFKIGLSAGFKIKRNSREYLQLSLDELLDAAHTDKSIYKLFEDFVRQYLFLENRSGWFPREDLLAVVAELFKQHNTYQKPFLMHEIKQEHFVWKRKIYGLMQELRACCPAQTSKRFLDHLDELLSNDQGTFDIDDLAAYWARPDFPLNKNGELSPEAMGLWRRLTGEICSLCLQEARGMFNPYVALFERLMVVFGQLSRRDDVLFLEELNLKAAMLFDNDLVTVEELYFRLAARLAHYLVDEFQDTSMSQWRNLQPMVEEALAHGGSLFYVGDKKQAIYSFRGGESRLFDALQMQLANFNVKSVSLQKNYRSCPEIIRFNNRVFGLDNLKNFLQRRLDDSLQKKRQEVGFSKEDFETIANTFGQAQQLQGKDLKGGVVRTFSLEGRTKEERFAELRSQLAELMQDLRKRFALKDICFLTRGNDQLEEITQWLLSEGIYASSERSSDIKNNPLVAELVHLLRCLHTPTDNDAFAQFCLGELMPQATGIAAGDLRDFLFGCALKARKQEIYFYQEFRLGFPEVWGRFFEELFSQVGVVPLYEMTAGIIQGFDCEKYFPRYQGFLMHLLELVKKQEKESCDLSSFLEYYDNLEGEERFVPMAQMDAVKVLTVHKAKGLEFPVVILPFLEMDIKAGTGGRDGAQAYVMDIEQSGISLIRLKESYRQFCPQLQARYEEEYKKAFLVELNSVYVAMTRAIEELYIFIPGKVGNAVNPAKYLIPEDCLFIGTPSERPVSHQPPAAHHLIKSFVSGPWVSLQEDLLTQPVVSAVLARKGEFYHALLMHLGNLHDEHADRQIEKAWEKAISLFPSHDGQLQRSTSVDEVRSFINRPEVRRFFYLPAGTGIFCEKEFVNTFGDTRRIDRLMVLKDEVWIVDFKLSPVAAPEHQKQMDGYVELIKHFYPRHKVSGHILYLT